MAGQECMLQIGRPVLRSCSWMTLSIPSNRRFCSTTNETHEYCGGHEEGDNQGNPTLMGEPFAFFDQDWLSCQSHKIALDDQVCILLAEEEWRSPVCIGHFLIQWIVDDG